MFNTWHQYIYIYIYIYIELIVKFKEYLNSKHQNINFTSELECNGKLPFLDNLID